MPRIRRTYFRYAGCMSRRKFVQAHLAFAGMACMAALVWILALWIVSHENGIQPGDAAFDALVAAGGLTAVVIVVWAASAVVVKRCRDIGMPAWPMLAALFLTPVLDRLLLAPLAQARLAWPLDSLTPLGGAVIASAWLLLLCLPSRRPAPLRGRTESAAGARRAFG